VAWRPKNSPAVYDGPLTARQGLARSKNVMAIRLLRQIGLDNTINFLPRFGFKASELPRAEPIALGAGNLTPLQMAQGFGVFANGGYYVQSYWVKKILTATGERVYTAHTPQECAGGKCEPTVNAERVISDKNAFLVREMLEANIWGGGSWKDKSAWMGTGWRAMKELNRHDIGGKTGTTNDSKDAWYVGFAPKLVVSTWIGFDNHNRNLGYTSRYESLNDPIHGAEAGGKSAQPAWISFMKRELANVPELPKVVPNGIVQVRIDRRTGLLTRQEGEGTMMEYFIAGTEPTTYGASSSRPSGGGAVSATDELF
ncbi:MAG: penicillin-binding transpeptidase domain-containing protein, partial [Enterovibrio sp.]